MNLKIKGSQLSEFPGLTDNLLGKLISKVKWEANDLSRGNLQKLFDDNIKLHNAILYSPVVTAEFLDTYVPRAWEGATILDEDGEESSRLTYGEFFRVTEVTGGYVLQYASAAKGSNGSILTPRWSRLKSQVNKLGGFLTKKEVEAILLEETE